MTPSQVIFVRIHPQSKWMPGVRQYDERGQETTSICPPYEDTYIVCDNCNKGFRKSEMNVNDYAERFCPHCGNGDFYFEYEEFKYPHGNAVSKKDKS